jgi:hypothetical protein
MFTLPRAANIAGAILCSGALLLGAPRQAPQPGPEQSPRPGSGQAGKYPFNVVVDANVKTASASVTSRVSISVEMLMGEKPRQRAADGLKYGGYLGFFKELRTLPVVGTIAVSGRQVEIRYAHQQPRDDGHRLVLVSDRPLFFLTTDPSKPRAGYELTIVELLIDGKGTITGTMTGAARVKLGHDGVPIVDDFAEAPVQLTGKTTW